MKIKRFCTNLLFLLSLLFLCCGCDNGSLSVPPASKPSGTGVATTGESSDKLSTDATKSALTYAVDKYMPLKLQDTDIEYSYRMLHMDAYGSSLYILADYYTETGERVDTTLHVFEMNTRELGRVVFQLEAPQLASFSISSMDVLSPSKLSLDIAGREKEEDDLSHFLYITDMTGKCTEPLVPFPDRGTYPWNPEFGTWSIYDTPGHPSYITEWDDATSTSKLYRYNEETGTRTALDLADNNLLITALCADSEENLYYVANNHIYLYDAKSKTESEICSLQDNGILTYGDCHLLINDAKELALVVISGENPGVYFFAEKDISQVSNEYDIRLAHMQLYGMDYVNQKLTFLSTTSDTFDILMEKVNTQQEMEAFHDRIMAEITAGGGPDLLWVTEEDMRMLAEKGALMDISDLIPAETKEQLLPGVMEMGTVNGSFVALAPEVSFYTMMVADSVWKEESWTLNDVLTILENENQREIPFVYNRIKMDYYSLFFMILATDWNHSPFIDFEQGISYFNSEGFINTLELCKKFGNVDDAPLESDERLQMLHDGEIIGNISYFYNGLQDFSQIMSTSGDISHIVGYPVNEGSGNYVSADGYLVVNANATRIEEIKEILAYILNYENQYTVNLSPVRKDVIRDSIRKHSVSGEYRIAKNINETLVTQLATKPDGTTYLEEFMVFAESAVPKPYRPTDITAILYDEMPSYFTGNKSAGEVAEIIHNRVQLYLDEHY